MKRLTVTVLLFTFSLGAFANNKIQKGDYLFLSARLIDCSDAMRMIDYAKVSSNGDVTFFKGLGKSKGVKINVIDKSVEVAEALLLKVYSKRFGYRP